MTTIFLTGFMGSGKTTVGRLLADRLQWRFIDTDTAIEQQEQQTCQSIIERQGIEHFRQLEHNLLAELVKSDIRQTIIATGGGMPCHNDNITLMKSAGYVIYLKWEPDNLATRLLLTDTNTRPLIKNFDSGQLAQYIINELAQREKFYRQSHLTISAPINNSRCSPTDDSEIATYIIKILNDDYQRNTGSDNQ